MTLKILERAGIKKEGEEIDVVKRSVPHSTIMSHANMLRELLVPGHSHSSQLIWCFGDNFFSPRGN